MFLLCFGELFIDGESYSVEQNILTPLNLVSRKESNSRLRITRPIHQLNRMNSITLSLRLWFLIL